MKIASWREATDTSEDSWVDVFRRQIYELAPSSKFAMRLMRLMRLRPSSSARCCSR